MKTAEHTWTDHKTHTDFAKELNITPVLDKIQDYKRRWIQHVNRMPRNRLPRLIKIYTPKSRRNQGRPPKRFLDVLDRNGSTNGPTP
jgi:Zn-dependent M32 family carboxypeptidase